MSWLQPQASKHFEEYPDEGEFIKYLGAIFQVSFADRMYIGKSEYSYYILKPNRKPANRYGIHSEIVAIYAPYSEVQARTLSAVKTIQSKFKERVHPVWTILISDDDLTAQHYDQLKESIGLEVYCIPFARKELQNKPDAQFIFGRLEEYIQKRDLFAVQSPLQSNLFLFGRDQLIQQITSKIEQGQNFGLFGLRKVGKTSVLFAVERYLDTAGGYLVVHLDCQLPSVYLRRWNTLLAQICEKMTGQNYEGLSYSKQVQSFEEIIGQLDKKVVLIFDEIENIGFDNISPQEHWNEDFLPFWSTIRAVHQSSQGKLVFGVAGVNPHIFEVPLVQGKDNPFSLGVEPIYLRFLDAVAIRDMVRTIGDYMGLTFEADVFSWLFQQFGGHPLLTRKVCSLIYHKEVEINGTSLQLEDFTANATWIDQHLDKDVRNILIVMAQHYEEEFEYLLSLANGDTEWIELVVAENPHALDHILNYSIVERRGDNLVFSIETVMRFLQKYGETLKATVKVLSRSSNPTNYDMLPEMDQLKLWARLSNARNIVEPRLRTLIYRMFLMTDGARTGLQTALKYLPPKRQSELAGYDLKDIFGGKSKALYLNDLKNMVMGEWEKFKHIFGNDRKKFEFQVDMLNSYRADAHANDIDEQTVQQVEAVSQLLLQELSAFLD